MNAASLKDGIIKSVLEIDDELVLNNVMQFISFQKKQEPYVLSVEEEKAIDLGLKQVKNNEVFTEEEANKQVEEWLNSK